MRKLFVIFCITIFSTLLVTAQGSSDHKKTEFFAGYSHGAVDGSTFRFVRVQNDFGNTGPFKFHGANASGVYNLGRYVGVKADFSATFHGGDYSLPLIPGTAINGNARNSLYNFLGGVQFKDNSTDRIFKPFGHIMVGAGHARSRVSETCTGPGCGNVILRSSSEETGLAGVVGGGIDIKLNDRFDVRLIQVDYNPVNLDSGMLHNARFGVGIVFK